MGYLLRVLIQEIIPILAQSQDAITFKIIYSIKEERPLKEGKIKFIKALFDNDLNEDKAIPCKEAGLSQKGRYSSDYEPRWCNVQARKAEGDANPRAGLNPSKHFQERRLALEATRNISPAPDSFQ